MTSSEYTCPLGRDTSDLLAYVEGELDRAARSQVEEHIQTCGSCATEVAALARTESMLRSFSEAFHPEVDALYLFAASGRDPSGKIGSHVLSCDRCREDVDLFREMASSRLETAERTAKIPRPVMRELESLYGTGMGSGRSTGLVAALLSLVRVPFRAPALALGTAAAVLVISVVGVPMWRTFQEGTGAGKVLSSGEPATVDQKVERDAVEGDGAIREGRRHRWGDTTTKEKGALPDGLIVPAEEKPSSAPVPALGARPGALPPAIEAPARKKDEAARPDTPPAMDPGYGSLKKRSAPEEKKAAVSEDRSGRALPAPVAPSRLERSTGAVSVPRTSVEQEGMKAGLIPVKVRVIDSEGRPIPGLGFDPPTGLRARYRFLVDEEAGKEYGQAAQIPLSETRLQDTDSLRGEGRLVTVRVTRMGDLYDLEATLSDSVSMRDTRVSKAAGVSEGQLRSTINALVIAVLQDR